MNRSLAIIWVALTLALASLGCDDTLRASFYPSCGGLNHGGCSDLPDADVEHLIAYLKTL